MIGYPDLKHPGKRESLEKFGYRPYVNMDSYKEDPKPVKSTLGSVRENVLAMLGDLIREE